MRHDTRARIARQAAATDRMGGPRFDRVSPGGNHRARSNDGVGGALCPDCRGVMSLPLPGIGKKTAGENPVFRIQL